MLIFSRVMVKVRIRVSLSLWLVSVSAITVKTMVYSLCHTHLSFKEIRTNSTYNRVHIVVCCQPMSRPKSVGICTAASQL